MVLCCEALLSKAFQALLVPSLLFCQTKVFFLAEHLDPALLAIWFNSFVSSFISFSWVAVPAKTFLAFVNFMLLSLLANKFLRTSTFVANFCNGPSASFLPVFVNVWALSAFSRAASQSALAAVHWSLALFFVPALSTGSLHLFLPHLLPHHHWGSHLSRQVGFPLLCPCLCLWGLLCLLSKLSLSLTSRLAASGLLHPNFTSHPIHRCLLHWPRTLGLWSKFFPSSP